MLQAVLVLADTVAYIFRPRRILLAEIALLRRQLAVLKRSVAFARNAVGPDRVGRARYHHADLEEHAADRPT